MADEDQKTASGANASFDLMADYLGWEIVGRLNVGGCSTADDLHEEDLTAAYEFGKNLYTVDRIKKEDLLCKPSFLLSKHSAVVHGQRRNERQNSGKDQLHRRERLQTGEKIRPAVGFQLDAV